MKVDFTIPGSFQTTSMLIEGVRLKKEIDTWAKDNGILILNLRVNIAIGSHGHRIQGLFQSLEDATLFMMKFN